MFRTHRGTRRQHCVSYNLFKVYKGRYATYSAASVRIVGGAIEGPAKDQLVGNGGPGVELLDHAERGWLGQGNDEAKEEGESSGGELHGGGLVGGGLVGLVWAGVGSC